MRRNVIMTDEVFDSPSCIAYDEAENRLHVQKAIMTTLIVNERGPGPGFTEPGRAPDHRPSALQYE